MEKVTTKKREIGYSQTQRIQIYPKTPGDRFIWPGLPFRVVKDQDVLTDVDESAESDNPEDASIGLCGSDVLEMQPELASRLDTRALGRLGTLRFSLLAQKGRESEVLERMASGEPIPIGTSYEQIASKYLGNRAIVEVVRRGCTEGLLERFPNLLAVLDMSRSGASAEVNGLVEILEVTPIQLMLIMKMANR